MGFKRPNTPLNNTVLGLSFLSTSLHFQLSQIIFSLGLPTFFLPAHFLSKISPGTLVSFLLLSHTSHFLLISTIRLEVLYNSCNSYLVLVCQTSCSITDPHNYTEIFIFHAFNITSSFSSLYFIQNLNWFYQYFLYSNFLYSATSSGVNTTLQTITPQTAHSISNFDFIINFIIKKLG